MFVVVAGAYLVLRPNAVYWGHPSMNSCINNLRQLDGAAEQWRIEYNRATNAVPTFAQAYPYFKSPPVCPSGGTYSYNTNSGLPICSVKGHVYP